MVASPIEPRSARLRGEPVRRRGGVDPDRFEPRGLDRSRDRRPDLTGVGPGAGVAQPGASVSTRAGWPSSQSAIASAPAEQLAHLVGPCDEHRPGRTGRRRTAGPRRPADVRPEPRGRPSARPAAGAPRSSNSSR